MRSRLGTRLVADRGGGPVPRRDSVSQCTRQKCGTTDAGAHLHRGGMDTNDLLVELA